MIFPICGFDAKNNILCPQCEGKVDTGVLTKADVEASVTLAKNDIMIIRQSRTIYRLLQDNFKQKIWLVEADETDKKFIEDLFFPTKILAINVVWSKGIKKTKAIVSGKWTPKFPIDTKKVIEIVKNVRNLDIDIDFEDK